MPETDLQKTENIILEMGKSYQVKKTLLPMVSSELLPPASFAH